MLLLEKRMESFARLGRLMVSFANGEEGTDNLSSDFNEYLNKAIVLAQNYNAWFNPDNVIKAIHAIGSSLDETKMKSWLKAYPTLTEATHQPIPVTVIMAGNIPLVGFHDYLCVLLSGNHLVAKTSSDDQLLLPLLHEFLIKINHGFSESVTFVNRPVKEVKAVIATGSDNTSRYFDYYFGNYPNIIRKNRTGIAVLDGSETEDDLTLLTADLFTYFGLGCRNVSKLFLPQGFDTDRLFKVIFPWGTELMKHNKYMNNYDYYKAIYLLNKESFVENGFVLLKEDPSLYSPVAVINYEFYEDHVEVKKRLNEEKNNIQVVVTKDSSIPGAIPFGKAQQPELWDYADGVDTMEFLSQLN